MPVNEGTIMSSFGAMGRTQFFTAICVALGAIAMPRSPIT
jgi:hypothetical protein